MQFNKEPNTPGLAWVEKGQLRIKDPGPQGSPATIQPASGVKVFVTGTEISGRTEVTESCDVVIKPEEIPPRVSFKFQISQDDLKAYVVFQLEEGVRYMLNDSPPSSELKFDVRRQVIPAVPRLNKVVESAKKAGIRFGLDLEACRKACEERSMEPVLIASGTPHIPGKDGKLEFTLPLERVIDLPLDNNRVDFRSSIKIPDIKAGQTIAVKTAALFGVPGKGVSGKSISPKRPFDPRLRAGKGVEIRQEGNMFFAVATTSGCPRHNETTGVVEVDEIYYHRGDVDLASGNMKTSGSIEISGNIVEGMKVESDGNQSIGGTVTEAQLRAGGSVTVRGNVFKSQISVGKDARWLHKWNHSLGTVEENLSRILEIRAQNRRLAEEIKNMPYEEQMGARTRLACPEVLFDCFKELILSLKGLYEEDLSQLPQEIRAGILGTAQKIAVRDQDIFQRAQVIEEDINSVRAWIDAELSRGESDVMLPYVQNSRIEASRDILVTGQGALYSYLSAGRSVKVLGSPGIVRGGETIASELIHVKQAGGRGSAATVLRVSEKGQIIAGIIHPNTTLILGRFRARTENTLESAKIRAKNHRLIISSDSGVFEIDD